MEAAGMISGVSAVTERYMSLQTGVYDVNLLGAAFQVDYKMYEVTNYYLEAGIGTFTNEAIWINLDRFNSLEPSTQEIIVEAGLLAEEFHMDDVTNNYSVAIQTLKDNGMVVNEMSAEDRATWAASIPDTPAENAAEMVTNGLPSGWEMTDYYQDAAEELGHTWPRRWAVR
jgi:TRAP-type C4-dicarboxylate transport system substrate-binding protein